MTGLEPSCSASYCQIAQQDVLTEYVKGLQEANHSLDADVAERLLQELAESLNSPTAAALVVSSGGARLIASCVKLFKVQSLLKIPKSTGKGSRLGSRTPPVSKNSEVDSVALSETSSLESVQSAPAERKHDIAAEVPAQHRQGFPAAAPNEARRKRQRTSGELDEDEDCKDECAGDNKKENCAPPLLMLENGKPSESFKDTNVLVARENVTDSSCRIYRSAGRFDGEDTSFLKGGQCNLPLDKAVKGRVDFRGETGSGRCNEGWLQVDENVGTNTGCKYIAAVDLLTNISNQKLGHSNGRTLFADVLDDLGETRPTGADKSMEFSVSFANGLEMATASLKALSVKSTSSCTFSLAKRKELVRVQKQMSKGFSYTDREKKEGVTLSVSSNGVVHEQVVISTDSEACKTALTGQISNKETGNPCYVGEEDASHRGDEDRDHLRHGRVCQGETDHFGLKGSHRVLRDSNLKNKQNGCLNGVSTMKAADDYIPFEDGKIEPPNVLHLAKEAGLPDVVAAACDALDKLISSALLGKGMSLNNKSAALPVLSGKRRGKAMSAEMYVALTEALVEIVQVLKDHVELLCWCLDCLGSILPPTSNDRPTCDGSLTAGCTGLSSFFSNKDLLHAAGCKGGKPEGISNKQLTPQQSNLRSSSQSSKQSSLAGDDELLPKTMPKSFSGVVSSGTCQNACGNVCSGSSKNGSGLGSSLCSSILSDSAASSISALAAVAYTATVPMLAEKAVKAVLSAMQPCDIEAHSTQAALHALSAHLSSTNSKYVCDDAVTFIIAAMREFKNDAEMQTESCMALASLNRAVSSATGHNAWSAIIDTMENHTTNVIVQRAGCGALQVLCTRAGLGVPEWGSGKRPLRAAKDTDRETGVRALISAMLSFPEDVRIQWHGCSTLWTLVHSAGVRSVANMVRNGAVPAVVGAMLVCRMNEMMQQEGCNVLGTMARTLSENGYEFGPLTPSGLERGVSSATGHKSSDRDLESDQGIGKFNVPRDGEGKERCSSSSDEWWEALKVVVAAMRAFSKSKSVQSNGTFALGCILKGSVETIHLGLTSEGTSPMPGLPFSNSKLSKADSFVVNSCGNDIPISKQDQKGFSPLLNADTCFEQAGVKHAETIACLGNDLIDDIERLNAAVEVTMSAMPEFPKVETVQVWGCAVLQLAVLAYVHYSKRMKPLASSGSTTSFGSPQEDVYCKGLIDVKHPSQVANDSAIPSPTSALANLVLSQATSAMFMISGMMALSYSGTATNGAQQAQNKGAPSLPLKALPKLITGKPSGVKSQISAMSQSLPSVRQSWCAALGAIGDVFGHLTRNSEISLGRTFPSMADSLNLTPNSGSVDRSDDRIHISNVRSSQAVDEMTEYLKEGKVGCIQDEEDGVTIGPVAPTRYPKFFDGLNESKSVAEAFNEHSTSSLKKKLAEGSRDSKRESQRDVESSSDKRVLDRYQVSEGKEQKSTRKDWRRVDTLSQQQAVKDIKAWQEATESLAKIAERVGFPMSVKNAILAIRTVLYKLEDAETVIWACHALISLYLTWENVHLFKPGVESDREDYKAKIWGEGDVGVKQLVYLVSHWTGQNRADVTSLALQALYSACVFAATVREIGEVFAPGGCGTEAVLGAMQAALGSAGTLAQRKKVVQQSCCVLATVCGYSIPAQVAFAAAGAADIILASLDRYDEDSQILVNGLHALGLDSRLQLDFDALWNLAIYRNTPSSGSKGGRRKRGGSSAGSVVVGLSHIFKEGAGVLPVTSMIPSDERGAADDTDEYEASGKSRWLPQLERLVFDGTAQMGLFRTWLIAGPGCGGPPFATEVLRRLNVESQSRASVAEMLSHVCLIVGYMSAHDTKWRQGFIDAGALEAVLDCMGSFYNWRDESFQTFNMIMDGVEKITHPEQFKIQDRSFFPQGKPKSGASENFKYEDKGSSCGVVSSLDAPLQCAACSALAGLVKDHKGSFPVSVNSIIQALATALYRYGGLLHLDLQIARAEQLHSEVCAPARLALARLGVSRIGDKKGKHLAHEAAEAGDLSSLEALGQKGVDLLAPDDIGHIPLWYAERSGQMKAVQYLKDQAQLYGRRRAREKSKAKSRQGGAKDGVKYFEKELQDVQEEDVSHECLDTADLESFSALKSAKFKENFIPKVDRCHPISSDKELKSSKNVQDLSTFEGENFPHSTACSGAFSLDTGDLQNQALDLNVVEMVSTKSVIRGKKLSTGAKRSHLKEEKVKDFTLLSLTEGCTSRCPGERLNENVSRPKEGLDVALLSNKPELMNKELSEALFSAEFEAAAVQDCEKLLNGNATVFARPEDDTDETSRQNVVSDVVDPPVPTEKSEIVNRALREALFSGVIENLEAAVQACREPDCGADDTLLKKVKASLSKRLKRMEKSAALQEELSAAIQEGKSSRLHAAILAIEKVPRFAAAFDEKIAAARHLLVDIESKERVMEKEEAHVAFECNGHGEALVVHTEDDGYGGHEASMTYSLIQGGGKLVDAEGEDQIQVQEGSQQYPDSILWTNVHAGRQSRERQIREYPAALDYVTGSPVARNRPRRERGNSGRHKGISVRKHALCASRVPVSHLGNGCMRTLPSKGSGPVSQPFDLISLGSQEMPPLLPTPQSSEIVSLSTSQMACSVIQPPRHKDQTVSLSEHNPITPQLFPPSRGPPLGYSCQKESERRDESGISLSSFGSKSQARPEGESGLLHISQLFPPWASPQLFTYRDTVRQNPWPPDSLVEQGGSTPGSLASLLATILPSHVTGAVSSSSTLFSAPFGKTPFPLSSCETAFSQDSPEALHPSSLSTLNVHAQPFLPTNESIVNSLPPFVQQALSCTCDEDGCQEQLQSSSSPRPTALSACHFAGDIDEACQNRHSKFGMLLMKNRPAEGCCDSRTGLNCLVRHDLQHMSQGHLQQAALLDASMEDSCCICYDRPKDAALISCGHRMCKGCAEEMHRIRHLCPVCNRIIEAVLALYG